MQPLNLKEQRLKEVAVLAGGLLENTGITSRLVSALVLVWSLSKMYFYHWCDMKGIPRTCCNAETCWEQQGSVLDLISSNRAYKMQEIDKKGGKD